MQTVKLSALTPDARNANKGNVRGTAMIEDSLSEFGAGRSILIDKNNRIIAGNKTTEGSASIGIDDVIIVETDGTKLVAVKRTDIDLDSPRGRKLALVDNRAGEVSLDWDVQALADLQAEGVDLSGLWDSDELNELLSSLQEPAEDPGAQIDKAEELQAKWQVQRGDLWKIGDHRLLCGDSTSAEDVARVMGGERADAVATDVPYGISQHSNGLRRLDYGEWDKETADDVAFCAIRLCSDIATITAFCGDEQLSHIFELWTDRTTRTVAWIKSNPTVLNGEYVFLPALELAAHGRKSGAWFGGHCVRSVWEGSAPQDRNHPNQKPTDLFVWVIENTCPLQGAIYDPFLGSGTTLVACEQTGRKGRGIEIEPKYCAVILERLSLMGLVPEKVQS